MKYEIEIKNGINKGARLIATRKDDVYYYCPDSEDEEKCVGIRIQDVSLVQEIYVLRRCWRCDSYRVKVIAEEDYEICIKEDYSYRVYCTNCGIQTSKYRTKKEAIDDWELDNDKT